MRLYENRQERGANNDEKNIFQMMLLSRGQMRR